MVSDSLFRLEGFVIEMLYPIDSELHETTPKTNSKAKKRCGFIFIMQTFRLPGSHTKEIVKNTTQIFQYYQIIYDNLQIDRLNL